MGVGRREHGLQIATRKGMGRAGEAARAKDKTAKEISKGEGTIRFGGLLGIDSAKALEKPKKERAKRQRRCVK